MGLFDFFKPDIDALIQKRNVKGLIKALKRKEPEIREQAVVALGDMKDPMALEGLFRVLNDENFSISIKAVEAIGKIGDRRAVEPLLTRLNNPACALKPFIINALGEIGSERAAEGLMAFLYSEKKDSPIREKVKQNISKTGADAVPVLVRFLAFKEWEIRNFAVETLVRIGSPSVPHLIDALKSNNGDLKLHAAGLLGRIKDSRAVEALMPLLEDNNSQVRFTVGNALRNLAIPPGLKAEYMVKTGDWKGAVSLGRESVPHLIKVLEDKSKRSYAINALGEIGDERAFEALNSIIKDEDINIRLAVVTALEKTGGKKAVPSIAKALNDKDGRVRRNALISLEKILGGDVINYIAPVLDDRDMTVKTDIIKLLEKHKNSDTWKLLVRFLRDESDRVRQEAAQSLGKIGSGEGIDFLIAGFEDPSPAVRVAAINAVGGMGDKKGIVPLIKALENKDKGVVIASINALTGLQDERATEGLIKALEHSDKTVRNQAVIALEETGDIRALPPLIKLFNRDRELSPVIIKALRKFQDERAVDCFVKVIRGEKGNMGIEAVEALIEIDGEKAMEGLIEALGSHDGAVREKAFQALEKTDKIEDPRVACFKAFQEKNWKALRNFGSSAVDYLIIALKDKEWEVRREAALTLGEMEDERGAEPLIELLKDLNKEVAAAAALALEGLEGKAIKDRNILMRLAVERGDWKKVISFGSQAIETLILLLKKYPPNVPEVEYAIGQIGEPACEPLIKELTATPGTAWKLRTSIVKILGKIGNKRAAQVLRGELNSPNDGIKAIAAEALGRVKDTGSVGPLIKLLEKRNIHIFRPAAKALGNIGDKRALEPLIRAMRDQHLLSAADEAVRAIGLPEDRQLLAMYYIALQQWQELAALGSIAVKPLTEALQDSRESVRVSAAEALEKTGLPPDIETKAWYLAAKKEWVKAAELGSVAAKPLLKSLWENNNPRLDVILALGRIGDPAAVDALLQFINSGDRQIRESAVDSLVKIRDKKAVKPLINVFNNIGLDKEIRKYAAKALGNFGDPEAICYLISVLKNDCNQSLRRASAFALKNLYNSGIPAKDKQAILSVRGTMSQPHEDRVSSDCGGHTDTGIGVYL